jgi:SAM-dependent methyltransferase
VNPIELFLVNFEANLANDNFRKLTLGKLKDHLHGVEHVYVRVVTLKDGKRLNFVRRYPDRDLTQNYHFPEGIALVRSWLGTASFSATLLTIDQRHQLLFNRRGDPRLSTSSAEPAEADYKHDREKSRLLQDETFLQHLGVLDPSGIPTTRMHDKYRQIHHFIHLLAPALQTLPMGKELTVVDMGSGKGYLTFALYAFLKQEGFKARVVGVERRSALVDLCNRLAVQCKFTDLRFEVGEISDVPLENVDVVIALHACDTATDDAIYRGITAKAQLIFLAPCCHQELRPQLTAPADIAPLFTHGIQAERMAESITDALRCLYLEASGYSTTIQEFIALEHTKKNLLLSAAKSPKPVDHSSLFQKASDFQALFEITHQRLADLLRAKNLPTPSRGTTIETRKERTCPQISTPN